MHRSTAVPPSLLTCLLVFATSLTAQSIQYDEGRKLWLFSNEQSSYAMEVGPQGELEHLYWGPPLPRIQDFPPAVPRPDISSFDPHQMLDNQEYRSEEHTSELQSRVDLVCRLLLEKKKKDINLVAH